MVTPPPPFSFWQSEIQPTEWEKLYTCPAKVIPVNDLFDVDASMVRRGKGRSSGRGAQRGGRRHAHRGRVRSHRALCLIWSGAPARAPGGQVLSNNPATHPPTVATQVRIIPADYITAGQVQTFGVPKGARALSSTGVALTCVAGRGVGGVGATATGAAAPIVRRSHMCGGPHVRNAPGCLREPRGALRACFAATLRQREEEASFLGLNHPSVLW